MGLSLDKIEASAPGLVSLAKEARVSLEKASLVGVSAKVALCLDYSGSMRRLYKDGWVQSLAERVLALGAQFDDDGDIEVFLFDSSAKYAGSLGLGDYQGGVDRLTDGRSMGTTNYAAAIKAVREHYGTKKGFFGRKKEAGPKDVPVYVIFVTDGQPDSRTAATKELVEASREGIFWQFVGIGDNDFRYLEKLDSEVKGRLVDNANFFQVKDPERVSDSELYAKMLAEFPDWLPQAKELGLVR
jgi:uncharacterized protein YegL